MSRCASEECGAASPDDRIFDRSKEWLSSEKREMLVHYFNHKAITQQQEQQEVSQASDSDAVTTGHHHYSSAPSHPKREWLDAADNYQVVERRRHYSTGQDRQISTGLQSISCYHNDDDSQLNSNQKNTRHYKSCNMIGPVMPAVHDSIDHQFYQARSVHQIPDTGYSNRKENYSYSNNKKGNYSSPNLAMSSQGLEYICNFKSTPRPHKISNQINGYLMQTRSAQDLSIHGIHGNHHNASSVGRSLSTAGDHKSYKRRRRHKNCLVM